MLEEWILGVDMVSQGGFLDTRASYLIDIIISFLVTLPIATICSIFFVKRGYIKIHQFLQISLFFITIGSLSIFAYTVHYIEGFDYLIRKSSINPNMAFAILTIHVLSVITATMTWFLTIFYAINDKKRRALPGVYSGPHRRAGWRVLLSIVMVSITSLGIYWVLYIA